MSYINDHESGTIIPLSQHIIEVNGLNKSLNGFILYLDNGTPIGDYSKFTYFYRVVNAEKLTYQYSDDGSIYVEPIIEEPIVVEPTEEELAEIERQNKIAKISEEISRLKYELIADDYIIIKLYELSLVGETSTEYDMAEIHVKRDNLRAQINELEKELEIL